MAIDEQNLGSDSQGLVLLHGSAIPFTDPWRNQMVMAIPSHFLTEANAQLLWWFRVWKDCARYHRSNSSNIWLISRIPLISWHSHIIISYQCDQLDHPTAISMSVSWTSLLSFNKSAHQDELSIEVLRYHAMRISDIFLRCLDMVHGGNPAPVDRWFIPFFVGFQPSFWWCRIPSIHTVMAIHWLSLVISMELYNHYSENLGHKMWCVLIPNEWP